MSFTTGGSRWSDVYLATAARGVATCGEFLAATTLVLALQGSGAGGLAVSALLLAATVPLVAFAPLTGRLADRVESRLLLVCAGLAQVVICAALAYAGHPMLVVGLAGLLACGLAVTQPVIAALVPAMVHRDDLPRASALNQTAGTLGALAGPALAGLLVGQFGVRLPLLVAATGYLALVVAGLLIRTRRGGPAGADPSAVDGGPDPAAWRLRHDRLLLAMVVTLATVVGAVGAINVIEVFYIRDTLGSSTTMFGLVTGAWTLGVLIGAWIFARLAGRFADDGALIRTGLALLAGCCLMVLAAATVPAALWLVPLWLVGGVCNGGNNVFNTVVLARRVPAAARGRAFAALGAAVQGASMAGYLIGGLVLESAAPRPLVAAAGVAGLLAVAAVVVPVGRAVRRERSATGRPIEPLPGAGFATPVPAG